MTMSTRRSRHRTTPRCDRPKSATTRGFKRVNFTPSFSSVITSAFVTITRRRSFKFIHSSSSSSVANRRRLVIHPLVVRVDVDIVIDASRDVRGETLIKEFSSTHSRHRRCVVEVEWEAIEGKREIERERVVERERRNPGVGDRSRRSRANGENDGGDHARFFHRTHWASERECARSRRGVVLRRHDVVKGHGERHDARCEHDRDSTVR